MWWCRSVFSALWQFIYWCLSWNVGIFKHWHEWVSGTLIFCSLVLCFRKVKELSGTSGPGSSMLLSKGTTSWNTYEFLTLALSKFMQLLFMIPVPPQWETHVAASFTHRLCSTDDSLRTAPFTMATQSTSSMPVLIRSNTTSLLDRASTLDLRGSAMDHKTSTLDQRDHRTITLDHRTSNMDHRNNVMDQRTSTIDHRTSTLDKRDHRTSTLAQRDHRTSTLDQRSKTMDRGCGVKDSQSRKLSMWVDRMFWS